MTELANPPALYGVGEGTRNLKKFTDQIEGSLEGRMATLEVGAASELDPPCPRALFHSFSGPGGAFCFVSRHTRLHAGVDRPPEGQHAELVGFPPHMYSGWAQF